MHYIETASQFKTPLGVNCSIELIRGTIFDDIIHFRMEKAHEGPYATVCKAVSEEA